LALLLLQCVAVLSAFPAVLVLLVLLVLLLLLVLVLLLLLLLLLLVLLLLLLLLLLADVSLMMTLAVPMCSDLSCASLRPLSLRTEASYLLSWILSTIPSSSQWLPIVNPNNPAGSHSTHSPCVL
jgi:hypothetical protein